MRLTKNVKLSPTQEEWKTIKFWIGTFFGAIIVSTVLQPEKIRFLRINPFIYLGLCGIISGFIAGNGYYSGFVSTATDDDKSFFKACSSTTAIFLKCY